MQITSKKVGKNIKYVATPDVETDWLTDYDSENGNIFEYIGSKKVTSKSLSALDRFYEITDEEHQEFIAEQDAAYAELEAGYEIDESIIEP